MKEGSRAFASEEYMNSEGKNAEKMTGKIAGKNVTVIEHRIKSKVKDGINRFQRNRNYGLYFYLPLFFLLSFLGWLWERILGSSGIDSVIRQGEFFGPWIPFYGLAGVLLVYLLGGIERSPVLVYFSSMVIGTVTEYGAGRFLEWICGIRWRDYQNEFLNINGRSCLWSSLLFGLAGWLLVCYGAPYLRLLYRKLLRMQHGRKILQAVSLLLIIIFLADAAWAADFPSMKVF